MKCQNCGAMNQENDKFCGNCGYKLFKPEIHPEPVHEKPIERFSRPVVEIMSSSTEDTCPKCHRDDRVVRVKNVFLDGVRSVSTSGPTIGVGVYGGKLGVGIGGSSQSGISQSAQSARLSPPEKRTKGKGCFLVFILLSVGSAIDMTVMNSANIPIPIFAIVALIGGIFIILGRRKKNKAIEETYNSLLAGWGTLFYCDRDDVVFQPGSRTYMRVEEMQAYFKNRIEQAGSDLSDNDPPYINSSSDY